MKASGHTFNDEVHTQPTGWHHVELRIDALARDRKDIVQLGIDVGDIVAIHPQPEFLENGYIRQRMEDGVAISVCLGKSSASPLGVVPVR